MTRTSQRVYLALAPSIDPSQDLATLSASAAAVDSAGVDLLLFGHPFFRQHGVDALSLAAALAPTTHRIGLTAAIDFNALAPFHLARALASLDLLSAGRSGWMTLFDQADDPEAFDRFCEHLQVVCALFDSWEDQALIFDKDRSLFTDADRVHRIRHRGRHFAVDGPLNTPRPLQGRPVILQASGAAVGDLADIVLLAGEDVSPAIAGRLHLQELVVDFAASSTPVDGSPSGIAEGAPSLEGLAAQMATRMRQRDVQGFLLLLPAGVGVMDQLVSALVPRLREEGFHLGCEAASDCGALASSRDLRSRLKLRRPLNRFAPVPAAAAS